MKAEPRTLLLGYEVGVEIPRDVQIPLKHMAITGQTQEAGKTTALEALISRSGLKAVTFITKRGEASFTGARRIEPYFREQADWQFVASILEASRGEKLKFERAWIIRASKGARTLADVQRNVRAQLDNPKIRGMSADVYLTLDAYLDVVVPEIEKIEWATGVDLRDGVNAVDLTDLSMEMQHLVIRSTISWILHREKNTVVVIPEAWKFIPQGRGTPVKLAAESFIRQGAAMGNYLWLDSQDLGGIEKTILRSVPVWILGVQREANEIKRTLDNIPAGFKKPKPANIATLELGQFFACWGQHAIKTYVQPAWLPDHVAIQVACGETPIGAVRAYEPAHDTIEILERPKKSPPKHIRIEPKPPQPERPKAMSYDEQLAEAHRRADRLIAEIHDAITRLGGTWDEKWNDEELLAQLRETVSAFLNSRQPAAAIANGTTGTTVQMGPIDIAATERTVSITFSQETREFETTNVPGRLMFALVHELKRAGSEAEMTAVMRERGWNHAHGAVSPELSRLVKKGDLISEGARPVKYRIPGKLKLVIDGKRV